MKADFTITELVMGLFAVVFIGVIIVFSTGLMGGTSEFGNIWEKMNFSFGGSVAALTPDDRIAANSVAALVCAVNSASLGYKDSCVNEINKKHEEVASLPNITCSGGGYTSVDKFNIVSKDRESAVAECKKDCTDNGIASSYGF